MKYMGSKNRISKHLLPIILKDRKKGQYYVEPFCGGCNMIDKVKGNRIASDYNRYLIAMWKGFQANEPRMESITREVYDRAKKEYKNGTNIEFTDFEIGWIGYMASFNGKFYDGGYGGKSKGRDYTAEAMNNIGRQFENIQGVEFFHSDYKELEIPDESIIYCDIPYRDTTEYSVGRFDHIEFFDWCREMSEIGHTVFISEYTAPEDFICLWEKEVTNSLSLSTTHNPIEKLFTY